MKKSCLSAEFATRELQWCYRKCELLLAPSSIEGFGLPVAEALLAGCRIVCSDILAFRELEGKNCHYVPLDVDGGRGIRGRDQQSTH